MYSRKDEDWTIVYFYSFMSFILYILISYVIINYKNYKK